MDDSCILELCDPDGLPVGQAIRLAGAGSRVGPNLAPAIGAFVGYLADSVVPDEKLMQRALEVLCAVSDPRSFALTCAREMDGKPVANAMVRWLAAGAPRRGGGGVARRWRTRWCGGWRRARSAVSRGCPGRRGSANKDQDTPSQYLSLRDMIALRRLTDE